MDKSLNGKELGKGISQRKNGLYQGRFVNRFGKKQTVYAKTLCYEGNRKWNAAEEFAEDTWTRHPCMARN